MFTMITPTLPVLNRAWAITSTVAGATVLCTGGYLIGRTTTRWLSFGAARIAEGLADWDRRVLSDDFAKKRSAIERRKTVLQEAVDAEIDRRIKTGELNTTNIVPPRSPTADGKSPSGL